MRKNNMMRKAAGLTIVTLLTTSVIAGVFAKYTTEDRGSDAARVAKWGVSLQVTGDLYGDTYKDSIVKKGADEITVQANSVQGDSPSSEVDNVLAPGTKNDDGLKFSLTGTPEVSTQTKVTIKTQNVFLNPGTYGMMVKVPDGTVTETNFKELGKLYVLTNSGYEEANSFDESVESYYTLEDEVNTSDLDTYYPMIYKLTGDTLYTSGTIKEDSLSKIAEAIVAKFGTTTTPDTDEYNITTYEITSKEINPNTDLDTEFGIDNEVITWNWNFEGKTDGDKADIKDKADTILGLLMKKEEAGTDAIDGTVVKLSSNVYTEPVEHKDYCLDTSFDIDITVSQVD